MPPQVENLPLPPESQQKVSVTINIGQLTIGEKKYEINENTIPGEIQEEIKESLRNKRIVILCSVGTNKNVKVNI